jgi:hypothetical protein
MTQIINLWAGQGTGKSRTAAGLFNIMKHRGFKVELVTEVAKFYTYERNVMALKDQFLLLAQQEYSLRIVADHGVDWIVTDSPPMMGIAYAAQKDVPILRQCARHFRGRYLNYDVFLKRDPSRPYEPYGREPNEAEGIAKDPAIHALFETACSHDTCMDYDEQVADDEVVERIYDRMIRWAKPRDSSESRQATE